MSEKKVFIKTYGCQMNVYDSERMADVLALMGYTSTDAPDDADMVILNTCHIREKASEKVYSELGRVKKFKDQKAEKGEDMLLAVAGCVAQAEGEEIINRQPAVDMVFGPQTYHELPDLVARAQGKEKRVLNTDFPVEDKFDHLPKVRRSNGPAAFLSIQEGCDKFCTFCVVPYTRGAEFSRPVDQIDAEARQMVDGGVREITLLGQNVNAFHGVAPGDDASPWSLGRLVRHLAQIEGLQRIRYTTSHPRDMDEELISAHRDVAELMPYLHLPVQSGSDRILSAMNRQHTAEHYLRLVDRIRDARPDIALSCDFIVGFPGETDEDFEATMSLVRKVGYAQAFSFKYSARPGTPAADAEDQVPETVKSQRLAALQDLLTQQQRDFNQSCVGSSLDVLLEKTGRHDGQLVGRSPYLQAVHVQAPLGLIGQTACVIINDAQPNSLSGVLVQSTGTEHLKQDVRA